MQPAPTPLSSRAQRGIPTPCTSSWVGALRFAQHDRRDERLIRALLAVLFCLVFPCLLLAETGSLELTRPVRPWEFLPVVGTRAALFGREAGPFEAWVYPLKIFRNFRLNFLIDGQTLPAESLARTLIVRPESSTIVYSGDTFSVQETLFVPVHEPGAIVVLEVTTASPLEVEAVFERDLQLEWPAALGGTYINWDAGLHAFALGEEQRKYVAFVGSPSATQSRQEYFSNYSASRENAFRLGATPKGSETKVIVIAASMQGREEAESTYRRLTTKGADLLRESTAYYQRYLDRTVNLDLPDDALQTAYDWARISMAQGLVTNPSLGTGLVAGYRTSGDGQRPGFAWYFGRDSMWTSLALTASGDFANTRAALEFLSKYQRADGKIAHEISQAANFVPWFTDYPYAYASADATPLLIIAADDYVTRSGDAAFAKEKWDSLWKAYQFLRSTYDAKGFPQNSGIGHGWVEGGPLLPVKAELYQVGLGAEALRALSHLATLIGKDDAAQELTSAFARQKDLLNQMFWSQEKNLFAFAVDTNYNRVDVPSVLATVPMWFNLLDADKTQRMINLLAGPDHQADWGMRIISSDDPKYNPGGYHFGSVWPLFTGWASVGEYRYHRAQPAYSSLRANALLATGGSLGHVTEVLSGDYNESISTASPHQIWSAAMVVSPILRGMLGIEVDAQSHLLRFRPHVPADWTYLRVRNLHVGDVILDLTYRKTLSGISLEVQRTGSGNCTVEFSPALSPMAKMTRSEINGRAVTANAEKNGVDQHVSVKFPVEGSSVSVSIGTRNDFGMALHSELPALGSANRGLRVTSESWDIKRSKLVMNISGTAGSEYEFDLWNAGQIVSVEGGEVLRDERGGPKLRVKFPANGTAAYSNRQLTVNFAP